MATTMTKPANNLGFLMTFVAPSLLVAAGVTGQRVGFGDWLAFLPAIVALVIVPILSMIGVNWDEPTPARPIGGIERSLLRAIPLAAVPVQLMVLAFATDHWMRGGLGVAGRVGWLLSTGIFGALVSITIAHELIHHRNRLDRMAGGVLLSTVCFGTFKIVHPHIHHRFVATSRDFASAARGDSIYGFWLRALAGNLVEALRYERAHLRRHHRRFWQSELAIWYALSLLWLIIAIAIWGWMGGAFFLLQSLIAIMVLDWTNYVQHYGLRRAVDARGRYEAVQPHHSWSMQCRISNLALLNLLRHGHHHAQPLVPYHDLSHTDEPTYPYPFGFMMLLALATPVFRRVVHPLLDRSAPVTEVVS